MRNELSQIELEGKLIAHRKLLQLLVVHVARLQKHPDQFWASLQNEAMVHDGEEDPGAEPNSAYAIENAAAYELENLLDCCRKNFK